MKINVELSKEQLNLIIDALEVNFRLMMRQGSIVSDLLANHVFPNKEKCGKNWQSAFDEWLTKREDASYIIDTLSKILYVPGRDMPDDCHRMSDMWSAFRHLQWQLLHNDDDHWDVRSIEPFKMSDYDMIKIELLEE